MSYNAAAFEAAKQAQDIVAARLVETMMHLVPHLPAPKNDVVRDLIGEYERLEVEIRVALGLDP